ncbi:MAG: hypothetical protein H0V17_30240, partial [Deltaproteobacteria bacterium]|nr:hypothetical protein [Deltaproteobacteria bacterium]
MNKLVNQRVVVGLLLASSLGTASAGPRVANSEPAKSEPACIAWVEDKCVAREGGATIDTDDDAKKPTAKPVAKPDPGKSTATPPVPAQPNAPAIAGDPKAASVATPGDPAPKATAAVESISSSDTVGGTGKSGGPATVDVKDVRFEIHGYARMPLAAQGKREPYLVDNDYFLSGFAYTRLYEPDWSELFFSARKGNYKVELGMFASLYSDYASARLENQFGIAQASVTAEKFLDHEPLTVQLGVFWDRFGYIQPYDTYVFGRTHQGGFKVAYKLPG